MPDVLRRGAYRFFAYAWPRVGFGELRLASSSASSRIAEISTIPRERIRNFGIIAHIDHGKSTLSDRLIEACGVLPKNAPDQFLDGLEVEQKRGITIKAQTCSLLIRSQKNGEAYLLNLIDTPGHVDFCYEVSRSLHACQGAVLLVDVSQGIQAQTVSTFNQAFHADLEVVCAASKCDLAHVADAQKLEVKQQMANLSGAPVNEILEVSGKSGMGVPDLFEAIIDRIPPPPGDATLTLKALLFDLYYDNHKGIVLLVAIRDGEVKRGAKVHCSFGGKSFTVVEVGILHPTMFPLDRLGAGQVGYITVGAKDIRGFRVGETIWADGSQKLPGAAPFPGFRPSRPMVYAGIFPEAVGDGEKLDIAMQRLLLTDASVESTRDVSNVLGAGFRCGFLGLLHLDVFKERLLAEYQVAVIATSPTVPYRVTLANGDEQLLETAAEFPTAPQMPPKRVEEPLVHATIVVPRELVPAVQMLCLEKRGREIATESLDNLGNSVMLKWELPMAEVIVDFFNKLQSATHGYASYDYEPMGFQDVDLVKIGIRLNGEMVEALSFLALRDKSSVSAAKFLEKLANMIPAQQFEINLQGLVGGKVVAKNRVKAIRREMVQKDHSLAGDPSRKAKIENKQKEGKLKLREIAKVQVPAEAFVAMVRL